MHLLPFRVWPVRLRGFLHHPVSCICHQNENRELIGAGQQKPLVHIGDIEARHYFLDVRNVCAAYWSCMEMRETILRGSLLNISSGMTIRIDDMFTALLAEATVAAEPSRRPLTVIAGANRDFYKIRQATGSKPDLTCAEKLRGVLDDWRGSATRLESAGVRLP